MTVKQFSELPLIFCNTNPETSIEVITNLGHPAELLSVDYDKVNDVLYFKYETEEGK